jgi:hypothetical protein
MQSLVGHLVVMLFREGKTTDDMALKTELLPDEVSPSAAIWGRSSSFPKLASSKKSEKALHFAVTPCKTPLIANEEL